MVSREEKRFCPYCGRMAVTDEEDHGQILWCWKCDIPMKIKEEDP